MKILLGMSGGVDSAVAARVLLDEGHEVVGAVLKMHEYTELCAARTAAEEIGIPLVEIDCTEDFERVVKANLVSEYASARTPNPCIICNERVKMRRLYEYAVEYGFDKIATGHYARIVALGGESSPRHAVAAASDMKKDQSYMLYRLPEEILAMLLLPLADADKENVRAAAVRMELSSAQKRDSQEICFLPNGGHAEYVESVLGKSPEGDFIDTEGNILGRHKGIIRYTVGQRKGLGIALGERMFVTEINPENNTVTLAPRLLGRHTVEVSDTVFSGISEPAAGQRRNLLCKLRYTAAMLPATVVFHGEGRVTLEFCEAVKAAPGQSAVLYDNGVICFGGIIE